MKDHTLYEEMLPLFVSGNCTAEDSKILQAHLTDCVECQREVEFWKTVSTIIRTSDESIRAPESLFNRVMTPDTRSSRFVNAFRKYWALILSQLRLVQNELWPVSALVMFIGILVAVIADKVVVIYFISPLIAASTMTVLYGADHDPAYELTRSTATSPWKILLARLSIVSFYNLILGLVASTALLLIVTPEPLGTIILGWVGPLAFLSSLALLISIWLGTGSAIILSYSLWLLQYLSYKSLNQWFSAPFWEVLLEKYKAFWNNPVQLVCLSILVFICALWSANRPVLHLVSTKS